MNDIPTRYCTEAVVRAAYHTSDLVEANCDASEIINRVARDLVQWAGHLVENFHTDQAEVIARLTAEILVLADAHGRGELLPPPDPPIFDGECKAA